MLESQSVFLNILNELEFWLYISIVILTYYYLVSRFILESLKNLCVIEFGVMMLR